MKQYLHLVLFLAGLSLFFCNGVARCEKYYFRNYGVQHGLQSNLVNSVIQDRNGYLWFATNAGIGRFDGMTFTTYTTSNGLKSNGAFRIAEDSKGNLWFSFREMQVARFDGETWTFYEDNFQSGFVIWSIMEDAGGDMWFATFGDGVVRYDGNECTRYSAEEVGEGRVRTIFQDSGGTIWAGLQSKGFSFFNGMSWENYSFPEVNHNLHINSIIEDSRGNMWLAGYGGWALESFLLRIPRGAQIEDYELFRNSDGIPPGADPVLIEDSRGRIWMATEGGGLGVYDGSTWKLYSMANGLPLNNISSMIEDNEGNLWIGTSGNGVARFSGEAVVKYTVDDGLPGNSVVPVLVDSRDDLWFNGRFIDGVTRYDGESWTTLTAEDGLGSEQVESIYEDSRGTVWFCSGHSLVSYDGSNLSRFSQDHWVGGISYEDNDGNLWLEAPNIFNGSEFEVVPGAVEYSLTRTKLCEYTKYALTEGIYITGSDKGLHVTDGFDEALLNEQREFNAIIEAQQGGLWFGTDSGLIHSEIENYMEFALENQRIAGTYYTVEDGLAHNDILALYQDKHGNLWVGTNGGGVSRFTDGEFTNYTISNELSNNVCQYIFEAEDGIYFGAPKGLHRFNGKRFITITAENDGLTASLSTLPLKDSLGNFWFSSPDGVLRYDPSAAKSPLPPPPVYITRFRVSDNDTTVTGGLRLAHSENSMRIDYVGISLYAPEDVVYSYKLEGLDEEWTETALNTAAYRYLPPGRYNFTVNAMNRSGVRSERPASLQFEILPPFWATIWFRGLILTVVLGLGWGVHTVRTRFIRKKNIELLGEISERKKAEKALREKHLEVERLKDRLEAENIYLQEEIKLSHNFKEIIGNSNALNRVLENVEKVASTDANVLILGETGTGKQLIARAVHRVSPRADRPLVTVNCATLPRDLIESELFGHEKGAFTGALSRKIGRFEVADGATLFLDEIGELPLELQAKLLRVLQDGEFERLGSSRTVKVDVRIIAATNRDLEKEVARGYFREDLYFRLNVYPIKCPPLREHKEDIPLLVNHFVNVFGARTGKKFDSIPQSVMDSLRVYHWPGNIRELENIIERAVIVSRDGGQLKLSENLASGTSGKGLSSVCTLEELERKHIAGVLELTGWKVRGKTGAAELLAIKPTTLEARMKKLGIRRAEQHRNSST